MNISIHPLSVLLVLYRVAGGAGADPSWHWASIGPTYIETDNHSHSHLRAI